MTKFIKIGTAAVTLSALLFAGKMAVNAVDDTPFKSQGAINSSVISFNANELEELRKTYKEAADVAYLESYAKGYATTMAKSTKIVYDYHYHMDGDGNHITTEDYISPIEGGCYTIPYYHQHTSECYRQEVEWYEIVPANDYGGQIDNGNNRFMCSGWPKHYYSANEYVSGMGCKHIKNVLICNKAGRLEGYGCSCNKHDGQIIGATVNFD